MDKDLGRLKAICRWCFIGTKVLSALVIFSIVATIVLAIFVILNPQILIDYPIEIETTGDNMSMLQFLIYVSVLVFTLLVALAIVITLGGIFKSIYEEYSPFVQENYIRFKRVSLLVLLTMVFIPAKCYVGFTTNAMTDFMSSLTIAVLIYAIALIFHYGQYLQKESDETL